MTDRSPAPPPLGTSKTPVSRRTSVEQLLLKTLYGAEAIGSSIAEKMRLPFTMLEPLIEHARAERLMEVRGANGRECLRLSLHAHRPRPRTRAPVPRHQPVRRPGAGSAGCLRRADERARRQPRLPGPRAAEVGLPAPDRRRCDAREARARGQRRQGRVPLRAARKRQDGAWPKAWARRSAATCTCRTRSTWTATSSRCSTRSATSRSRRRGCGARGQRHPLRAARPPVGAHPAAGRHGRRRAHARHARPDVQPDLEILRGADPAEGERRRVPRGRLRPPAHAAAGAAEPLDRAAREPLRLPHPAHRQEVPAAVRRPHRVRDEPEPASLADEAFMRRIPYKIPDQRSDDGAVRRRSSS